MTNEAIVSKLLANIDDINTGNLLKLSEYFNLKSSDKNKLDLFDFFGTFIDKCLELCHSCDDYLYFLDAAILALKSRTKIIEGKATKSHILDEFLLSLQEISI